MNRKLIVLIILALLLFSVLVFARSSDSRSFSKNNIVVSKSTDSRFTTIAPAFNETKKVAKADNSEDLLSLLTPPWHSNTTIEKTFQYLDPESLQTIPVQIKVSFKDENTYEINLFNNRNEKYFIKLLFSQTPKNDSKKHRLAENEGNRIQQTLLLFASPNTIPAFNENKLTNLFNKKEYIKLLFATKEYVSKQAGCEAYYYTDQTNEELIYCTKKCGTSNTYLCGSGPWGNGGIYNIQGFDAEYLCDYCTLKQEILDAYYDTCLKEFGDPFTAEDGDTFCGLFYPGVDGSCTVADPPCWSNQKYYYQTGIYIANCTYHYKNNCNTNNCTSGWKCKDNWTKAYQENDCTWNNIINCSNGCSNEQCIQNIACYSNSDCGTDEYTGSLFCQSNDVYQTLKSWTCNNAGTQNSSCSSSTQNKLIENCNYECNNGACQQQTCSSGWKCKDASTKAYQNSDCSWNNTTNCSYGCNNNECNPTPKCFTNSDCGTNGYTGSLFCQNDAIYQTFNSWTCNNAGTQTASCSNFSENKLIDDCDYKCSDGKCITSPKCSKDSDCGTEGYIDSPSCQDGDVYQAYKKYVCKNPGTSNSYCDDLKQNKKKEECNSNNCINGACTQNITCTKNTDCGTNSYTGNKYCKNNALYQQYKTYTCNNAGTPSSSCNNSTQEQKTQECTYGCTNGAKECNIQLAPQCTTGECCDIQKGTFKSASVVCDSDYSKQYSCNPNNSKQVMVSQTVQQCSGKSNQCNGDTETLSPIVLKNCTGNQTCSNGQCTEEQTTCLTEWKCKDASTKAYQNSDCTWSNVTNCSNGCSNGSCVPNQSNPNKNHYDVLMILAVPQDLWTGSKPSTHNLGIEWFEDLANKLEKYYDKISYGKDELDIDVSDWVVLPYDSSKYAGCDSCYDNKRIQEISDVIDYYAIQGQNLNNYNFIIVLDATGAPNSFLDNTWFYKTYLGNTWVWGIAPLPCQTKGKHGIIMPTFYNYTFNVKEKQLRFLAHEVFHALTNIKYDIKCNDDSKLSELLESDGHNGDDYCLMGYPIFPILNPIINVPPTEPWLDPVDAMKIGYSQPDLVSIPATIKLLAIDDVPNRQKKLTYNGKEYYLEHRKDSIPGSFFSTHETLVWANYKNSNLLGIEKSKKPFLLLHFDSFYCPTSPAGGICIGGDPTSSIYFKINSLDYDSSEVFVTGNVNDAWGLNPADNQNFSVWVNNCLSPNDEFNFRVVNSSGEAVYEGIVESDSNGCFDEPIIWNAEEDPNSEAENYLLALGTIDGWTSFKSFSLAHLDGVPKWKPLVSKKKSGFYLVNSSIITKVSVALNPLKIALEAADDIDSYTYEYEIDITAVKEDYKATNPATEYELIYSQKKPYLFKKDKGYYTEIKSNQIKAKDSGKTIEFYIPKQLLNNPEKIVIKAKTNYQQTCILKPCSEKAAADTFPKKIEITNTQKPLIELYTEKFNYKLGETITLKGNGFASNKIFNYEYKNNLTNETLCEGNVTSNSQGKINKKTCKITDNEQSYGTYKIYWENVFVGLFSIS